METKVLIHTEFITLGQLVKLLKLTSSGGGEKVFLSENEILINGEKDNRRGRKVRPGDKVTISAITYLICSSQESA